MNNVQTQSHAPADAGASAPAPVTLEDDMAAAVLARHAAFVMSEGAPGHEAGASLILPLANRLMASLRRQGYRLICDDEETKA